MRDTILITGGGGFLGRRLAMEIMARGHVHLPDGSLLKNPNLILADLTPPEALGGATSLALDIRDEAAVRQAVGSKVAAIYHLAAIVSGQAEQDFDLAMAVNLDGTRNVLSAARAQACRLPIITTSSLAVYGGALPDVLTEATATHPQNTYGMTKAVGEMLMSDHRRKGFAEARTLRLPTIIVRPGRPNAAASSFASGILREPLNGEDTTCPVDPNLALWLASPDIAIQALIRALEVPERAWPSFSALNVPGVTARVSELLEALPDAARARVTLARDPTIEAIVGTWPSAFDTSLAQRLGFAKDDSAAAIVAAYRATL